MAVKYPITLSVSEPNNNIGLLKVRQADEETQTLVVQVLEDAVSKSYEGLQVFFCARIGQTAGVGIIEQKLNPDEMTDPKNGKLEYTFRAEDWQVLGKQNAYFSFRKMADDHTYVQQFSTRDFTYEVTKNIYSDGIKEIKKDGSTYIWTLEDLLRLFRDFITQGENQMLDFESQWQDFVEANKEILGSVDPGGVLLREVIDARGDFNFLSNRLDTLASKSDLKLLPNFEFETLGGVREVFRDALQLIYSKIDSSKYNFVWLTDVHYDRGALYNEISLRHGITHLYNALSLSDKLDAIVLGGDNTDCAGIYDNPKSHVKNLNRQLATKLFAYSKAPLNALLKGNHDDGSSQAAMREHYFLEDSIRNKFLKPDYIMSDIDFSEVYRQNELLSGEIRNNGSNYFYHDNEEKKVRFIGLDSSDLSQEVDSNGYIKYPRQHFSGFGQDQLNWIVNEAFMAPDGYHIIIGMHHPLESVFEIYPGNDYDSSKSSAINHDVVLHLINQLKLRGKGNIKNDTSDIRMPVSVDYDFGTVNADLAFCIYGHIHRDDHVIKDGLLHIMSCCSQNESGEYNRDISTFNTLKEECFDVVELDSEKRKIIMRRVGAGNDRQFTY